MTDWIKLRTMELKYGSAILADVRNLEKLSKKIGRYSSHLRFVLHCKHKDVIPKFARISMKDTLHAVREIKRKAERSILNVHVTENRKKKEKLKKIKQSLQMKIKTTLSEEDFNAVMCMHKHVEDREFNKTRDIQKKKFDKLKNGTANPGVDRNHQQEDVNIQNSDKWVKNISSYTLTPAQECLLKKGADFAITPSQIPTEDYIVAAEQASKFMSKGEAAAMRAEVVEILQQAEPPKSNISKKEKQAMDELLENEEIIIVPADKGKCLVIMDRNDYEQKMHDKLQDRSTYKEIKKDPTKDIQALLVKQLQKRKGDNEIDEKLYRKLYIG